MDLDAIMLYVTQWHYANKEIDGSSTLLPKLRISLHYQDPEDIATALLYGIDFNTVHKMRELYGLTQTVVDRLYILQTSMYQNPFERLDCIRSQNDEVLKDIELHNLMFKSNLFNTINPLDLTHRIELKRKTDFYHECYIYFIYQKNHNQKQC